jgi:D-glycero-D-manno-heptose 1,7-bisphosphate phosphatase
MGGLGRRAAFIDRDGTINVRPAAHEYLTSDSAFRWLPGAAQGLARLAHTGYVLAVVSNQRGVARGLVSPAVLTAIEERIQRDLAPYGCRIDAFRYCVHEEHDGCSCRKPKPGMLLDLADEMTLDLRSSWMIGDAMSDVLAGRAAGCQTVLLRDDRVGAEGVPKSDDGAEADLVASSLDGASQLIADRTNRLVCR